MTKQLCFEGIEKKDKTAVKPGPSQLIIAAVFLKRASTTIYRVDS